MQLVAYGAQDIYLTGNPQITFFKVVYRRHTNFSMESIRQTFSGELSKTGGGRVTSTISRNGDLVHRLYLEIPQLSASAANPGVAWIDSVEVEIGGQTIDRQYGHWMETWSELSEVNPEGVSNHNSASGTMFQLMSYSGGVDNTQTGVTAFVPLQFWFCRNPGLSLPLIALQYHEVTIIVQGQNIPNGSGIDETQLWADYIYLDTDERRRFAQVSHEYLIEQLQYQSGTLNNTGLTLNFNHPVKELIWTGPVSNGSFVSASSVGSVVGGYQLKLNGHDRFALRDYRYFTRVQVWQYHTGICGLDTNTGGIRDNIAVYSFALRPEEHQPSGTCNFSRIDTAVLQNTQTSLDNANVYAVNYNVLRIMSGMGGLAYSN